MTGAHDLHRFTSALHDCALGIGAKPMTSERVVSYWDELTEYDIDDVCAGIRLAKREATRFLPSVGTLRQCVRQAQTQGYHAPATVVAALAAGEIHCRTCDDTGWRVQERAVPADLSPHYRTGATRTYARLCPCRPTNPIYQHHREMERRKTTGSQERT